jgi:hypothetical protein
MRYFLIFHTSNRVDFLSFYHQFPASSSREFALKPCFRAQTGHSWRLCRLLGVSNDFNARHVGHIDNIRSNRRCGIFQDCERFGKPFFCAAVNCPQGGYLDASMRRGLWFFLILAAGFRATPASPAGFAMADGANRSVAAPAIGGNPSPAESMPLARPVPGVASSCRAFPRHSIASTPNVPKNKALRDRAFRKYCGEHHISPKKNISAKQSISAT